MKAALIGINSKYIHSCLSIRYLKMCCPDMIMREYTINEQVETVTADIYKLHADVVLFACYIWNIRFAAEVSERLKKVSDCKIIFGGPEVTYNAAETMKKYPFIDAIMVGEGEETIAELEKNNMSPVGIDGMVYRDNDDIVENPPRELIKDFNKVPFPYTDEDIKALSGKLIYYESSRGCPFRCSYCLSSTIHSVRFLDLERVKKELMFFVKHKVKIVKFVDRTFNADKKRTYELLRFLIENADETTFHFEIAADLITDEMLDILKDAPKALFQFEIGVQSTNPNTLRAIDRYADNEKIKRAVVKVLKLGTVHVHLDLIAGLPYENLESFKKSFDEIFALNAHVLQLGFLKLLSGTKIRTQTDEFHYQYTSRPPYEILSNDFISYDDILLLKKVENILERYSNSGVFEKSIKYLTDNSKSAFGRFFDIAEFFENRGYDKVAHSQKGLYNVLAEYARDRNIDDIFFDYLKFDYFRHIKGASTPDWSLSEYDKSLLAYRFEFLNNEDNVRKYFSEYIGENPKVLIKKLTFEHFEYDVSESGKKENNIIIFDYSQDKFVKI